jgi:hypothetical protein
MVVRVYKYTMAGAKAFRKNPATIDALKKSTQPLLNQNDEP